jgi:hypothetical protein|nr:hypothetical protein [Pelagibacteraceae bacterium]
MTFSFQKKSQYSRHQISQTVTGTENSPKFDMGRTGYGRINNDLFIFMNIGIPGVMVGLRSPSVFIIYN